MSGYLKGFTKKENNLYNFKCPICGDSKKKQGKMRGYIHKHKDVWFFTCHNCNASMSFKSFLKKMNSPLFKEYMLETVGGFKKQPTPTKVKFKKPVFNTTDKPVQYDMGCATIEELPEMHPAKVYLQDRMIPFDNLFYTHEFFTWVNTKIPDKFKYIKEDQGRIIIPLMDETGHVFGIQGRALEPDVDNKYITIKFDEDVDKIYGLDKVDNTKPVYALEGVFDSMFIENSVATTDSNYVKVKKYINDAIIIPDTDVRNIQIIRAITKCINAGMKVCLLPQKDGKDINQMVQDGMTIDEIMDNVRKYTFSGLKLKIEFNRWKKV